MCYRIYAKAIPFYIGDLSIYGFCYFEGVLEPIPQILRDDYISSQTYRTSPVTDASRKRLKFLELCFPHSEYVQLRM